jgi:hypothetical protein
MGEHLIRLNKDVTHLVDTDRNSSVVLEINVSVDHSFFTAYCVNVDVNKTSEDQLIVGRDVEIHGLHRDGTQSVH